MPLRCATKQQRNQPTGRPRLDLQGQGSSQFPRATSATITASAFRKLGELWPRDLREEPVVSILARVNSVHHHCSAAFFLLPRSDILCSLQPYGVSHNRTSPRARPRREFTSITDK